MIGVEHDLSILDFLSDFVCVLYGEPGAYGVVTMPFSVREGINIFLAGFIPTENMRFRDFELTFKVVEAQEEKKETDSHFTHYSYPSMEKTLGDFHLNVTGGKFNSSEILVMVGENGTGKTTFIRMLAGQLDPDGGLKIPALFISYKPQKIAPKFEGTVREILNARIAKVIAHAYTFTQIILDLGQSSILIRGIETTTDRTLT